MTRPNSPCRNKKGQQNCESLLPELTYGGRIPFFHLNSYEGSKTAAGFPQLLKQHDNKRAQINAYLQKALLEEVEKAQKEGQAHLLLEDSSSPQASQDPATPHEHSSLWFYPSPKDYSTPSDHSSPKHYPTPQAFQNYPSPQQMGGLKRHFSMFYASEASEIDTEEGHYLIDDSALRGKTLQDIPAIPIVPLEFQEASFQGERTISLKTDAPLLQSYFNRQTKNTALSSNARLTSITPKISKQVNYGDTPESFFPNHYPSPLDTFFHQNSSSSTSQVMNTPPISNSGNSSKTTTSKSIEPIPISASTSQDSLHISSEPNPDDRHNRVKITNTSNKFSTYLMPDEVEALRIIRGYLRSATN